MEKETNILKKLKINFFDIVIIIVVIALAGAYAVHRMGGGSAVGSSAVETKKIVYKLEITDLDKNTEGLIKKGDSVMDKVKKYDVGTVKSVEFYPSKRLAEDKENAALVYTEEPDRYSALLTIEVVCKDDGDTLTSESGFEIRVGQGVSLVGPGYSGAGYITSIERDDKS
jgi:hypothetical protein